MGVIDAQLEAIKKQKPDVLLVSGDLTKDGELESHEQLAERLEKFKKEVPGVKVYVINGNHDINNENAKNYNTKDGKRTDATRTTRRSSGKPGHRSMMIQALSPATRLRKGRQPDVSPMPPASKTATL